MSKSVFKIVDDKGRITILAPIRASLGIARRGRGRHRSKPRRHRNKKGNSHG